MYSKVLAYRKGEQLLPTKNLNLHVALYSSLIKKKIKFRGIGCKVIYD
jgi:hypothetical protein